jgi:hypothetical protein
MPFFSSLHTSLSVLNPVNPRNLERRVSLYQLFIILFSLSVAHIALAVVIRFLLTLDMPSVLDKKQIINVKKDLRFIRGKNVYKSRSV